MKKKIFIFLSILVIFLLLGYEIFLKNKLDGLITNNYENELLKYTNHYDDLYNKIKEEYNLSNEDEINNYINYLKICSI